MATEVFGNWHRSLRENRLTPEQMTVLEKLVEEGTTKTLEQAASLLDFQDSVIDRDEHMYGNQLSRVAIAGQQVAGQAPGGYFRRRSLRVCAAEGVSRR